MREALYNVTRLLVFRERASRRRNRKSAIIIQDRDRDKVLKIEKRVSSSHLQVIPLYERLDKLY